jgi:hypothetical protein
MLPANASFAAQTGRFCHFGQTRNFVRVNTRISHDESVCCTITEKMMFFMLLPASARLATPALGPRLPRATRRAAGASCDVRQQVRTVHCRRRMITFIVVHTSL